jgi:ABC-2 type transport system ATP-binding protein
VIKESGLHTFVVEGQGARQLVSQLQDAPGVEFVAFFGAALHVSGHDRDALERALKSINGRQGLQVHETAPSLEDVFIQLQEKTG